MKINIISIGRYHVLDLARELSQCGHDVKFYSVYSDKKVAKYELKKECNCSIAFFLFPFRLLVRLFPKSKRVELLMYQACDLFMSWYIRPCDLLICMSGIYCYAIKKAKKRGENIILERGSKHILEQKKILESIASVQDKVQILDAIVKRELKGYELADYISVGSEHVKQSFLINGYPIEKLFINPYGVNLENFYPINDSQRNYDVIMTGNWSLQKGCDLLIEACKRMNLRLLHIGHLVDLSFPCSGTMQHIHFVEQKELVCYYSQAKIFVLPSRQEGLAMVQAEALACGLPIVFSQHTGGRDIMSVTGLNQWGFEMQEYTLECLCDCISRALEFEKICKRSEIACRLADMSWKSYGKRYNDFITKLDYNK